MLDYRAWIAAAVLLFAAAGGYLVYLHRTRAEYAARSLSAAGQPANESANQPAGASPHTSAANQTRTLHVDGCNKDFIVKVGELVEPCVVPGAPLTEFQSIYGREFKRNGSGIASWDEGAFTLTEGAFGTRQPTSLVHVSMHPGHVVETLDGIELGIDSFGALFRKLRDMKLDAHERIESSPEGWTLIVSLLFGVRSTLPQRIQPHPGRQPGDRPTYYSPSRQSGWKPGTIPVGCFHEQDHNRLRSHTLQWSR